MLQKVCVRKTTATGARAIRTRVRAGQVVALEILVRLDANIALMDAQQSCRFEWLEGTQPAAPRENAEHSMLTCTVALEKTSASSTPRDGGRLSARSSYSAVMFALVWE
jgi:hypothetical protein